jgi:diacylglycerol kinase family enzyme
LIAVGGDGTLHEVTNGMMFRADKKKVPLAFIPNGSGNDTCKSIGIFSID